MDRPPGKAQEKQTVRDFFSPDFYKRLGISKNVTADDLEKAYKSASKEALALDVQDGSEESGRAIRRTQVNEAYLHIKDKQKKDSMISAYDAGQPSQEPEKEEESFEQKKQKAFEWIKIWLNPKYINGIFFFLDSIDGWLKEGVVTKEELSSLSELKNAAIKKYRGWRFFWSKDF